MTVKNKKKTRYVCETLMTPFFNTYAKKLLESAKIWNISKSKRHNSVLDRA